MVTAIQSVLSKKKRVQTNKIYTKPLTQVLAQSPEQVIEQHASIMGTDVHILINSQNQKTSLEAISAAMAEMRRIDDDMTDWRPIGQVWKLNKQSGKQAVKVSKEMLGLIQQSVRISEMTGGLFDISYRGVGSLWDFYKEPHVIPSAEQIQAGLKKVGYQHMIINEQERTVYLPIAGMEIGLGGIAKGYAVDRAVAIIESFGFKDFVVNAGGDLYVRGSGSAQLWKVGIRHPRKENALIAEIPAKNYSIVTSGDYERFFIKDGKRYCHIVNPKTGFPAAACQSVTVLAKKCAEADALATGIFLMGPEKGLAFAEGLASVEALIIDASGDIHMTTGFQK